MIDIDVTEEINAAQRRVGSRTLDAGEARVVTVVRRYDAPLDDVWDACTSAERIPRWFLPIAGDLRLGGRYHLTGNASGTIERCDPPHGFAATWEYGGGVTWIELRLAEEEGGGTRFELDHIALVDEADEHWAQFGPGAVGIGWDMGLIGLGLHLATGANTDPADGAAWAASADGVRFVTLSSDGWAAADIAAGTDPAEARAKADRTTAAYTAPAPEA